MKGLEEYVKAHGNHFTEKLAIMVTSGKWNGSQIKKAIEGRVFYNVTDSSLGDMVFLTNAANSIYDAKGKCIKYMLDIVGNFYFYGGKIFECWLDYQDDNMDLTPYI